MAQDRIEKALDLAQPGTGRAKYLRPHRKQRDAQEVHYPDQSSWPLLELSEEQLEGARLLTSRADEHPVHAYKALRTQVIRRMTEYDFDTLAITSSGPDDGKTLTALNLAISIAADPERQVRLVELDLRKPSILRRLGASAERGVEDVLEGRAEPEEIILRLENFPRFTLMPAVHSTRNSSELLAGTRAREFVSWLRGEMPKQLIIFDMPPMLAYDDALTFAPLVDTVLLVASEGRSRREDVVRCIELLGDTPVIGTVLNRSREDTRRYYYY